MVEKISLLHNLWQCDFGVDCGDQKPKKTFDFEERGKRRKCNLTSYDSDDMVSSQSTKSFWTH